jgi:hypothetical protein
MFSPDGSGSGGAARTAKALASVEQRALKTLEWSRAAVWSASVLDVAFAYFTLDRVSCYRVLLGQCDAQQAGRAIGQTVNRFRRAGESEFIACSMLCRACIRFVEHNVDGARADLNEAWEIAERGPMRLHLADILLHRVRLFFRQQPCPWESPQDDLAAAEKLVKDCGYHRRDEELSDAKLAILGD